MKTTVLIVDDHSVLRQGLKALIGQQPDFVVCGEARDAESAVQVAAQQKPTVAVVDVALAGQNGLDVTKQIRSVSPETRVLVLSMHDEKLLAARALQAGASGYLMKEEAGDQVIVALRTILEGKPYLSAAATKEILAVNRTRQVGIYAAVDTLSEREKEVFQMIGEGFSTRQIADKLHLSIKTIDTYREHLKQKLSLESGADLVRYAVQWQRVKSV